MRNPAILFCLVAVGCKAPTVVLTVDLPAGYQASELTLAVSVYAPGGSSDIDCDAIAFGDYSSEQLLSSLALSTVLTGDGGELGELPRLGRKLVVVTGSNVDGVAVVGGCGELGDVQRRAALTIALEVSTRLLLDDRVDTLSAEVDYGSVTSTNEHVWLTAVDVRGDPVAGDAIRASTIGPSGNVLDRTLLAAAAAGALDHLPAVHFSGPFAVEYAVRFGLADKPLRVAGFVVNADPLVNPFADHPDVKWTAPVRIDGAGAGFIGVSREQTPAPPHVAFLSATASGWQDGRAQFSAVQQQRLVDGPVLPFPVGATFFVDSGAPQGIVKLLQHVDVSGGSWHFSDRYSVVDTAARQPPLLLDFANADPLPATNAVALGRCGASSEPDGLPLLVVFATPSSASNGLLHLAVSDLGSTPRVIDAAFFPRSSHCVVDADGGWHRVLLGRDFSQGVDGGEIVAIDLGTEQVTLANFDLGRYRQQVLHFTQAGASMVDDDGMPRLLLTSYGGFSMLLEVMQVSTEPDRVLERVRVVATTMPANAFELASGALVTAGRRDYVGMLDLGGSTTEPAPVVLYILAGQDDSARAPLVGGHLIPYCLRYNIGGVVTANCRMLIADIDGDGRDEILISYFNLTTAGRPVIERSGMLVLKLGEW